MISPREEARINVLGGARTPSGGEGGQRRERGVVEGRGGGTVISTSAHPQKLATGEPRRTFYSRGGRKQDFHKRSNSPLQHWAYNFL